MNELNRRILLAALLTLWAPAVRAEPAVLKVSTLVPRESPWGVVLRAWGKAVAARSSNGLSIEFYWSGTQGDEAAQVSKLKTGQLDGAVVTAVGLGVIEPQVNVLQLPGLYDGWAKLDAVREKLKGRFEQKFRAQGFELAGWGDVGLDRLMAKGFAPRAPADFKGKKPWIWREDLILPPVYQLLGVTPVATSVPEAIGELSSGNANAVSIAPLGAEQLQWSSRLDHLNTMVVAPSIGALLFSSARLAALTPAQRTLVLETGKAMADALTTRIRREDDEALERLKKKMTVVEPTPEELTAWRALFREARARLAKGTLPAALVAEVEDLVK